MQFFEIQTEFFVPLWRRILLVVFCFGWTVVEFATGAPFWGLLFAAIGIYAAWQFFFDGWPSPDEQTEQTETRESDD